MLKKIPLEEIENLEKRDIIVEYPIKEAWLMMENLNDRKQMTIIRIDRVQGDTVYLWSPSCTMIYQGKPNQQGKLY
jgi:hypothetical protein